MQEGRGETESPMMSILCGVVSAILVVILVIAITMKIRYSVGGVCMVVIVCHVMWSPYVVFSLYVFSVVIAMLVVVFVVANTRKNREGVWPVYVFGNHYILPNFFYGENLSYSL